MALHVFNFQHILQDSRSSLGQPVHTAPQPATTSKHRVAEGLPAWIRGHILLILLGGISQVLLLFAGQLGEKQPQQLGRLGHRCSKLFFGMAYMLFFFIDCHTRIHKPEASFFHDCHPGCSIEEIPRLGLL